MFGAPVAVAMGKGFVPVRKIGKLPHDTVKCEYALEYGTNIVEMHRDAIVPGQRALIVDDLLATGGTAAASATRPQRACSSSANGESGVSGAGAPAKTVTTRTRSPACTCCQIAPPHERTASSR